MKITYISNSACPSTVPSTLQIVKTCEYLTKHGNKIALIIPNSKTSKLSINNFYDIKYKFKIIRMKKFKKFPIGINYYLYSFLSFIKACKISDLIISRNFLIFFLCSIFKKKCIVELHSDISNESRIIKFIYNKFRILNSKSIYKIICISDSVKKKYINDLYIKNSKKIIVLPSGSSLNLIQKNSLKTKKLKIGYFGNINPSRGIDIILKLAQMDKNNHYFIYGGLNNQIMNLRKKYKINNLELNPYQNYKKVKNLMMEMDILLMPYSNKATVSGNVANIIDYMSPLKLFDYMSTGKLIISSEIKVLKEVINEKQCIFVKNYLNSNSWLLEINKIKDNIVKRNIIGKNSFKKSKIFSHNRRVLRYL